MMMEMTKGERWRRRVPLAIVAKPQLPIQPFNNFPGAHPAGLLEISTASHQYGMFDPARLRHRITSAIEPAGPTSSMYNTQAKTSVS